MYTVMTDYVEDNTRYPRKSGKVTNSLAKAIARAKRIKGYVVCGCRVIWA